MSLPSGQELSEPGEGERARDPSERSVLEPHCLAQWPLAPCGSQALGIHLVQTDGPYDQMTCHISKTLNENKKVKFLNFYMEPMFK